MTTAEFLEQYGRAMMRPTTGITAEELYRAFVGYRRGDYAAFRQLRGRDQAAVLHLFIAINEKGFVPEPLTFEDLRHFKPNEGRMGDPIEWQNDDYSAYIDFLNLVAERGYEMA